MRSGHEPSIPTSGITARDLFRETLASLVQRPGRSFLTMLGTLLGVGTYVAVLGLTSTAAGQIGESFNLLNATTVTVADVGTGNLADDRISFADDARARVDRLNGVVDSGVYFTPGIVPAPSIRASSSATATEPGVESRSLSFVAVDPGVFAVTGIQVAAGRVWDGFVQSRAEHVAVLGFDAARSLGISRLDARPVVFVNDVPFAVIGIVTNFDRLPELSAAVMIPTTTALARYRPPTEPRASMIIETRPGAAQLIAGQAARALRPDQPQLFKASAAMDPTELRAHVTADLNSLFLLLATVSLTIGAIGIANTTLVSVVERTSEIGLRRALGARPRHIAIQFVAEAAALGTLGGLVGTTLGIATTVATALARHWTAVIAPEIVVVAPLLGAAVGVVAGLYPALRAARIEPAEALRR